MLCGPICVLYMFLLPPFCSHVKVFTTSQTLFPVSAYRIRILRPTVAEPKTYAMFWPLVMSN